jgi:hypothetical protein
MRARQTVSMAGVWRYMSAGQISESLEIPINTVHSWIRAGDFPPPHVIIGHRYRARHAKLSTSRTLVGAGVAGLRAVQHNGEPRLTWSAAARSISRFGNESCLCISVP